MKQSALILFLSIILTGCNNNDVDVDELLHDPIEGTFKMYNISVDGEIQELSDCSKLNKWEFDTLGTGTAYLYDPDNCKLFSTQNLNWSKVENKYMIQSNKPFLEGTGIPDKYAAASLKNGALKMTLIYKSQKIEMTWKK